MKIALSALALAALVSSANAKPAAKPAKVQTVMVCPIMHHAVTKDESKSAQVGNVKAYFCCNDCKAQFNAMTPTQKKAKLATAMKLQAKNKKG